LVSFSIWRRWTRASSVGTTLCLRQRLQRPRFPPREPVHEGGSTCGGLGRFTLRVGPKARSHVIRLGIGFIVYGRCGLSSAIPSKAMRSPRHPRQAPGSRNFLRSSRAPLGSSTRATPNAEAVSHSAWSSRRRLCLSGRSSSAIDSVLSRAVGFLITRAEHSLFHKRSKNFIRRRAGAAGAIAAPARLHR
jgi:hypothetical protein